jgi:hypothetical protein
MGPYNTVGSVRTPQGTNVNHTANETLTSNPSGNRDWEPLYLQPWPRLASAVYYMLASLPVCEVPVGSRFFFK